MNKEEIIAMALEAGLAFDSEEYPEIWQIYMDVGREEIEHFAQLVEAKAYAKGRMDATLEFLKHLRQLHDSYSLPTEQSLIQARGEK